jgi:hypothetical protein
VPVVLVVLVVHTEDRLPKRGIAPFPRVVRQGTSGRAAKEIRGVDHDSMTQGERGKGSIDNIYVGRKELSPIALRQARTHLPNAECVQSMRRSRSLCETVFEPDEKETRSKLRALCPIRFQPSFAPDDRQPGQPWTKWDYQPPKMEDSQHGWPLFSSEAFPAFTSPGESCEQGSQPLM